MHFVPGISFSSFMLCHYFALAMLLFERRRHSTSSRLVLAAGIPKCSCPVLQVSALLIDRIPGSTNHCAQKQAARQLTAIFEILLLPGCQIWVDRKRVLLMTCAVAEAANESRARNPPFFFEMHEAPLGFNMPASKIKSSTMYAACPAIPTPNSPGQSCWTRWSLRL